MSREARAVHIDAQQRREAQHRPIRADLWRAEADAEREAGKQRCAELLAEVAEHRFGRHRARRCP